MITKDELIRSRRKTLEYFNKARIVLTQSEKENIEIADFGLGRLDDFGLQIVTYINTDKVCAKEMVLFPDQICPEHRHPAFGDKEGKEETFRCRWGEVYLYVPGEPTANPSGKEVPADKKNCFTVWKEIKLLPGEQYTLYPDTLHWFQAGSAGAIVSEFSTTSVDERDVFTDPQIERLPAVEN